MPTFLVYELQPPIKSGGRADGFGGYDEATISLWRGVQRLGSGQRDRDDKGFAAAVDADDGESAIKRVAALLDRPGDFIAIEATKREAIVTVPAGQ